MSSNTCLPLKPGPNPPLLLPLVGVSMNIAVVQQIVQQAVTCSHLKAVAATQVVEKHSLGDWAVEQ